MLQLTIQEFDFMKKIISIVLVLLIIVPSNIALAADKYVPITDKVSQTETYQFADELKDINSKDYDVSNRLIVSSEKDIDTLDAVDIATGIEGLYVLQFPSADSAKKAYNYYTSKSYVNYVEYDSKLENSLCSIETESRYNLTPNCYSTVTQNIDDAIKLMKKESISISTQNIGVIDTGISINNITKNRLAGGYSYLDDHSSDGTQDEYGHGSSVAGIIINNTLDAVRLYSYQIEDTGQPSTISYAVSAIYLAISDNCKIANCSFVLGEAKESKAMIEAANYANLHGMIIVCAAGNDSKELSGYKYPAMLDNSIAVGAVTSNKRITSFSNFGNAVDIYADGYALNSYDQSGSSKFFTGTSAASPLVASICSLLLYAKLGITVKEVKQLLLETGYSTNDENISEKHRIIADAYACVKKLLGCELEQVNLEYKVSKNECTGCSNISFSSNDENVEIYYELGLGRDPDISYKNCPGASEYKYNLGETIKLSKWQNVTVVAYAPSKAKTVLTFSAPIYTEESGYRLTKATSTQQYNIADRCQILDQKVIEVPDEIDSYSVEEIGKWCFTGNKVVEKIILPKSVKKIDKYAFAYCPNLKEVIAPGVEDCGIYAFDNCQSLVNVEMPNLTYANTGVFRNCTSLTNAKLGILDKIDNHAFFGCKNLKLIKTSDADISFAINTFKDCNRLTVLAPNGSSMESYAKGNNISLLGDVKKNGGSIRITDAGMRFGFQYNGTENKNIEEYGFVYTLGETDDLTVQNGTKLIAKNKINHGDYTTYNLVFTEVPYTSKAFNQTISAKGYIKIGGEYFYSDTVTHSYMTIADAVLKDNDVDESAKNSLKHILEKVV